MDCTTRRLLKTLGLWTIGGIYRPQERVGKGYGGLCFKGLDITNGTNVFIKILISPRGDMELSKFRMEHTVLQHIARHPLLKICPSPLFFFERDDQLAAALVTEWIEGTSLDQGFETFQLYTIADKIKLLRRINLTLIGASTFAQHRDVHPGNIIIMDAETAKLFPPHGWEEIETGVRLVDWGESLPHLFANYDESPDDHFLLADRVPKTISGTFDGLPPETFTEDQDIRISGIGGKAISWSFGLLSVRLLLGTSPKSFRSVAQFISGVQSGELKNWVDAISRDLLNLQCANAHIISALVGNLLKSDPNERLDINSAGIVLRDLMHEDLSFITSPQDVAAYVKDPHNYGGYARWKHKEEEENDG
ncbi:protein kinase domain-containing protein [Xanthomonas arboricola]|uniref:protein kinase domain-containing protein n=1 Tax=Xanthomonas arboricola TaxID=56448 RepID=UPI001FB98D93|nr:serine/threonine-protein kinase [Xanthomonas arboricola]